MTTGVADRCRRCGTKLRNNRQICPCCGLDSTDPNPLAAEVAAEGDQSGQPARRVVSAKAGVKICPVCMSSVPEEQMVDQDGQMLCPTCAENMKQKALRKAAGGPDKK